uniref:Uncharacterized protein n=1 Tax=Anguilla anguilla TaxID=7936 RepID=A0A0E9VWL8_ANGAN
MLFYKSYAAPHLIYDATAGI